MNAQPTHWDPTHRLVYAALGTNGSATTRLREQGDGLLRQTLQDPGPWHPLARRSGPLGHLTDDDIIKALMALSADQLVITSTDVTRGDSSEYVMTWRRVEPPPALTPCLLRYLEALTRGLSNKQIAEEFVISVKTVESALRELFARLGVQTRTQAMRVALERGIIRLPGA